MASIAELIERARRKSGANQSQIGTRLNRSRQTVTNWKSGERVPDDSEVIALARMAGEDPEAWLAVAQAARTEGTARKHWESIAKRLGIAASVVLAMGGLTALLPADQALAFMPLLGTMHYAKFAFALLIIAVAASCAATQQERSDAAMA